MTPSEVPREGRGPTHASQQSGVLVIRAWREDSAESALRSRITSVTNLDVPEEHVHHASTRDELHAVLDRWLDGLFGA